MTIRVFRIRQGASVRSLETDQAVRHRRFLTFAAGLSLLFGAFPSAADTSRDPDRRAAAVERQMTDAERLQLLVGWSGVPFLGIPSKLPRDVVAVAGYVPGIPRLKIPALLETDGGLGVANIPEIMRPGDTATAFASTLAVGASFDGALAYAVGSAMALEARDKGFNVLLAGGVNLTRDPRGGRNSEYFGEDPLLSGYLAGNLIKGTQDRGVLSTVKHFVAHDQASGPKFDTRIDESALRESDLLAFEIAIRIGNPGSVMCAYNQVNGQFSCGNDWLLNSVLKKDWHYPGWVMSDWGAVYSDHDFVAGLDQQSGAQFDEKVWFGEPLEHEIAAGRVSHARLSDAVKRILRSIYAVNLDEPAAKAPLDYDVDLAVAEEEAVKGSVLLKNNGILPVAKAVKKVLVVGGFAQVGVLTEGGWINVEPFKDVPFVIPGDRLVEHADQRQLYLRPSPLEALRQALPGVAVSFDLGYDPVVAAARAASADLVIVFATKWQTGTEDAGSLDLPQGQDALIEKIAEANPNAVVVLETANPVLMPWLSRVAAVLEAWYPGQRGARAIAEILIGAKNPSGRLPITFPSIYAPSYPPLIVAPPNAAVIPIDYKDGANFGYRKHGRDASPKPLFPFGFGLTYTQFSRSDLRLKFHGRALEAQATVKNEGARSGADVLQVYLVSVGGEPVRRLVGFTRVELAPGEERKLSVPIEPLTIARWQGRWNIPRSRYSFALCTDSESCGPVVEVELGPGSLTLHP